MRQQSNVRLKDQKKKKSKLLSTGYSSGGDQSLSFTKPGILVPIRSSSGSKKKERLDLESKKDGVVKKTNYLGETSPIMEKTRKRMKRRIAEEPAGMLGVG
jgi:hypothetical protein